ncbi:1603_t:CDS:2 [Paraglomus occultum]|uniref:1603_t:CDS:1 n=1 Tax=Paraglomus occultum TaxID=144539 RepID=A0A9N9F0B8_9GLOM|nr:1603_t:CDS:2 [Paraglomus occultum]
MSSQPESSQSSHVHDLVDQNKTHFNAIAKSYDTHPTRSMIGRKCGEAIIREYGHLFDANTTEVMDFACGTGLISEKLASYSKYILGVDAAQGMVDVYNQKCWQQGIDKTEMEAVCQMLTDEASEKGDQLNGKRFDIVVCSSSYHHFSSTQDITRILASYLKPSGHLIVLDLKYDEKTSPKFHSCGKHNNAVTSHTHKHEDGKHVDAVAHRGGFNLEDVKSMFENTNVLDNIRVEIAFTFEKFVESDEKNYEFEYWIASGRKF